MPSLLELKKHLHSIQMTGQLAGAMKTVSAAKLNRLNGALQRFSTYEDLCQQIVDRFGGDLAEMYPCSAPDAPECYVVLGANRGLCGGYNIELYSYADRILQQSLPTGSLLVVVGKHAIAHYRDSGLPIYREYTLPDTFRYEDCMSLFDEIVGLYTNGTVSSVTLIYQHFVNMLTQTPQSHRLLPLTRVDTHTDMAVEELYVPDRETVLGAAANTCLHADFYSHLLEAGAGNQAATLIAMRSAFDNAESSAAALEAAISRKRQSDVTSSVIETAGGFIEE